MNGILDIPRGERESKGRDGMYVRFDIQSRMIEWLDSYKDFVRLDRGRQRHDWRCPLSR